MDIVAYCITAFGLIGTVIYFLRRDAATIAEKDKEIEQKDAVLDDINKAKAAHDRLNVDSSYLAGVRDRFLRK